jgi:hypothetical protein
LKDGPSKLFLKLQYYIKLKLGKEAFKAACTQVDYEGQFSPEQKSKKVIAPA